MKSICLGLWNRNRKPRRLMNHVAAHPQAYDSLRKAWRVHAAGADEARRLIALFEAGPFPNVHGSCLKRQCRSKAELSESADVRSGQGIQTHIGRVGIDG